MPEDRLDAAALLRLADLARLQLGPQALAEAQRDLRRVVDHMACIDAVDLQDVAPTAHATARSGALREDRVVPGLSLDAVMRNAPERLGDGFGVPKIIE